jgi:tellurite resistance protein TehA-like permease
MKSTLLPTTTLGKWSIGLVIVFFLFFVVFLIEAKSGLLGGDTWTWDWPAIPILLAGVSAVSALVTGIIGIVKSRERSVLVFMSAALGLFVLFFVLGEFLVPH